MKYYAIVSEEGFGITNNDGYPLTSQEFSVVTLIRMNKLFRPLFATVEEVKREIVSVQKMFPYDIYGINFSYLEIHILADRSLVCSVSDEERDNILIEGILETLPNDAAKIIRSKLK